MAEYSVEGAELKKLMTLAKTKSLPFAFNPGKTDEEHYLAMHKKRDASVLAKSAKKEGVGKKVAYGTCYVNGSVLELTCSSLVPGIAKKFKKILKLNKVSLAVKVMSADGQVLEDDGEGLPEGADAAEEAGATAPKPAASKEEMGDRFTELQLKLKSLAGDAAKGLLNEVDSALSMLAYQSEEAIKATLDRIEDAFVSAEAEAEEVAAKEDAEREKLAKRATALKSRLEALGGSGAERLLTQVNYVAEKLATASLHGLGEALQKVETAARDLLPDLQDGEAPDAPAAPEAGKKQTKEEMTTDLSSLQAQLTEMVGEGAKALKGEVDSLLGTVAYQSEEAVGAALAKIREAMAIAKEESRKQEEEAAQALAALKARLDAAYAGISKVSGPAVQRLTSQADYLAEKLAQSVLDGVASALDGLEKAVKEVLPAEDPVAEAPAADPAQAEDPTKDDGAKDDRAALTALSKRLKTVAGLIAQTPEAAQTRLKGAFDAVVKRAKSSDIPGAQEGLAQIEAALTRLGVALDGAAADSTAKAASPQATKLRDALQAMEAKVAALPPGDTSAALKAQLAAASAQIDAGEVETVVTALKAVQLSLQLQAELDQLMPAFASAMSSGAVEDTNKLSILYNTAAECVPGPDHAKARASLDQVKAMLAAGGSDATREVAPDVQPFASSALRWRQTRGQLQAEMGKLEAAIKSACAGDEELQEVFESTGALFDYIKGLDERLDTKLDEIVNAEAGPGRDGLKTQALQLLTDYKQELTNPFFADVDAGNGFVNVAVTSTANAALGEIEKVLAAA